MSGLAVDLVIGWVIFLLSMSSFSPSMSSSVYSDSAGCRFY
eukprot:CAMPEP_0201939170 /NCGR_PEP_ID=MMETSP0903-20130614/42685_1 /ASSEMBLY_ACC=CAM_ASM_000552 /TAXON_ID=420261 /ORGANISM="Thalassiosira antarctica, Strain CCMP982" /LENGTH=40 /DNA_ID= /DNA_START= /DNA_END= /DNA_ORIENTATION=